MILTDVNHTLRMMVAIYEQNAEDERDTHAGRYYLETHEVYHGPDGRPLLREGKPISKQTFKEFGEYFATKKLERTKKQLLCGSPARLLYVDQDVDGPVYVWFCPSAKRNLKFTKDTKLENGDMIVPGLIFFASGYESLRVWAVKDKEITPKTKLFHAPFLNVYDDGRICLGDAQRDKIKEAGTFNEFIEAWENVFFVSKFSHGVATFDTAVKCGNVHKVTRETIKSKKPFPLSELAPFKENTNVEDLLDTIDYDND